MAGHSPMGSQGSTSLSLAACLPRARGPFLLRSGLQCSLKGLPYPCSLPFILHSHFPNNKSLVHLNSCRYLLLRGPNGTCFSVSGSFLPFCISQSHPCHGAGRHCFRYSWHPLPHGKRPSSCQNLQVSSGVTSYPGKSPDSISDKWSSARCMNISRERSLSPL